MLDVKVILPLNPLVLLSEIPNPVQVISDIPGKIIPNPLQPIIDISEKVTSMPLRMISTIVSKK